MRIRETNCSVLWAILLDPTVRRKDELKKRGAIQDFIPEWCRGTVLRIFLRPDGHYHICSILRRRAEEYL